MYVGTASNKLQPIVRFSSVRLIILILWMAELKYLIKMNFNDYNKEIERFR